MNTSLSTSGFGYDGYTCPTCGTWVQANTLHQCAGSVPAVSTNQWIWGYPGYPSAACDRIVRFCGTVKHPSDLPKAPKIGDAYYVKDFDALFVGHQGGWLLKLAE